ncbi:MAG: RNA polymerase sigma factor [Saprospiraceae bacterium]
MRVKEEYIIGLLEEQDKEAISILYDRYAATLYGIVLRIVRLESLAEDTVQETFVKAWRHRTSYNESKGTLFTWLLNIARNTAIDKTRSAEFRQRGKIQTLDSSVYSGEGLSIEFNPDCIGLDKFVKKLEEKYRIIVELIFYRGFTQNEVTEHLDIPLGTVKSRLRIALRELRKYFVEYSDISG